MDTTITSANSVVTLSVAGLFPAPVQLKGYSADRAWTTGPQEMAETQMSIDGRQTAGYVPSPVEQTFSFQADSPSKAIFASIARAMKAAKEVFYITATIDLPGTGESFICRKGVLVTNKALPDAAKVLQPVDYVIRWQSIDPTVS